MEHCDVRNLVVLFAFMMLAWQEPTFLLPYDEGLQGEAPGRDTCISCQDGSAHKDIPRITIDELKEEMDRGADIVILDAQPKAVYDKGHIKGAISFPWSARLTEENVRRFPRNKMIVTYCDCGPGEADASELAERLREMRFSNVKVLVDPSIRGWMKAGYPVEK
ncbi:MAG TPA: rhodanese-like domain-containing protein [Thermodesulfovibrionales bacterium]|nr:rhodanese-like domain-containing protein [Thermodesulfovibrionales bacterium]